jgi:Flp pilus assembly protein TadG
MTSFVGPSIIHRMRQRIAQCRADCRAVGAVEFAMILPLMMVLLFGTIEISNGFAVDRKVTLLTRTLSDLTSRSSSVSVVDLTNFFTIGGAIMQPYDPAPLKATITEVYIDPATSGARVQWSQGTNARTVGSPVTIPTGLISKDAGGTTLANQYLIMSEVSYLYTPVIGWVMNKAGITLSGKTYTRPRQSTCVYYPPPASGTTATCPTS